MVAMSILTAFQGTRIGNARKMPVCPSCFNSGGKGFSTGPLALPYYHQVCALLSSRLLSIFSSSSLMPTKSAARYYSGSATASPSLLITSVNE